MGGRVGARQVLSSVYDERCDYIKSLFDGKTGIVGAEIGVQQGRMAKRMLKWPALKEYWCIDPWKEYDGYMKGAGFHQITMHNFLHTAALFTDKVRILTLKGCEAAPIFPPKHFDFVFIDGDHSYVAVGQDILDWAQKVKVGGWLCGHDYGQESCSGVKQAVDEIFRSGVKTGPDYTWFIQRSAEG